jgi:LmbE family N-acetylglucosaminyl deacetylase/predicted amidohydrolase
MATSEAFSPRIRNIDIGYSPELGSVRIVFLVPKRPFPSLRLLNMSGDEFPRGKWGFIDEDCAEGKQISQTILRELERLARPNTIIILPEFGGGPKLTEKICSLLKKLNKQACYVVAGSYYSRRNGKIASVSPIVRGDGTLNEQFKFDPSDVEKELGCEPHHDKPFYVFQQTGFCNFAVAICSDALLARIERFRVELRQHQIHLLIVPARNRSTQLTNQLQTLSATEGILIAYCNGISAEKDVDSCVFTPSKSKRRLSVSRSSNSQCAQCVINIEKFYENSQNDRMSSQRVDVFDPRLIPWTTNSPLIFRQHPKVLAIGSHIDDIWLGCSATLMLLSERYKAQVVCSDLCDNYPYPYFGMYEINDRVHSRIEELCKKLRFKRYDRGWERQKNALTDREFPSLLRALSTRVEYLYNKYGDADLVFVPRQDDFHEDHALTSKEVLKEFRRSLVLEYEIKEFRRAPFHPSLLVDVTAKSHQEFTWASHRATRVICKASEVSFAEKKARILAEVFPTIFGSPELPSTFSKDYVLGRLSIRAVEAGLDGTYAEAFAGDHVIK